MSVFDLEESILSVSGSSTVVQNDAAEGFGVAFVETKVDAHDVALSPPFMHGDEGLDHVGRENGFHSLGTPT